MATQYELYLKTKIQIDKANLDSTLQKLEDYKAIQFRASVKLDGLEANDVSDILQKRFEEIRKMTDKFATIKINTGEEGIANKAVINYVDELNRKYTEFWSLTQRPFGTGNLDPKTGKEITEMRDVWIKTESVTDNISKTLKQIEQTESQIAKNAEKQVAADLKSLDALTKQTNTMSQRALETQAKFQGKTGSSQIGNVLDIQKQILVQKQLADEMIKIGNIPGTQKYTQSMVDLQNKSKVAEKSLGGVKGALESLNDGFVRAIKNVFEYSIAFDLLNGVMTQIRNGIQYIKDLNKVMTDTQLVSGGTQEQMKTLAMDYNTLAKEMGSTTQEIAKGI